MCVSWLLMKLCKPEYFWRLSKGEKQALRAVQTDGASGVKWTCWLKSQVCRIWEGGACWMDDNRMNKWSGEFSTTEEACSLSTATSTHPSMFIYSRHHLFIFPPLPWSPFSKWISKFLSERQEHDVLQEIPLVTPHSTQNKTFVRQHCAFLVLWCSFYT